VLNRAALPRFPHLQRLAVAEEKRGRTTTMRNETPRSVLEPCILIFEASCAAFEPIGHRLLPDPLNHSCVVIAVTQIVIQRGETVVLTVFFMFES